MNYLKKKGTAILFTLIALTFVSLSPASAAAPVERSGVGDPVNVIFDTDVCLDDDDGMALAIVHALQARHEAKLVAVTVGIDDKRCGSYMDVLNSFYGHPDIPIGIARNGLSVNAALENIKKGYGKAQTNVHAFTRFILTRKNSDGSPVYPHDLTDESQAPEAVSLLRKTLAAQPDGSVVMIQVGNSANFAALLDSRPDAISNLSGPDLVKRKVRFLSTMAGTFQETKLPGGTVIPKGIGVNIYDEVQSGRKVFSEWPTPIIASGAEIGGRIHIPITSFEHDFSYVQNHPVAESYHYMCNILLQANVIKECPWNHHTMDLTAALYAVRPDRNYFSLSKPGKITVLPNGNVRFDEDQHGKHHYLTVSEEQKVRAQEVMTLLVSQPPLRGNQR